MANRSAPYTDSMTSTKVDMAKNKIRDRTVSHAYQSFRNHSESDSDNTDIEKESRSGRSIFCTPKCFVLALVLCGLIILGLTVALVTFHIQPLQRGQTPAQDTCGTNECVKIAGKILSWMNLSANPCSDFYNYACGQFRVDQFLPPDKNRISPFGLLAIKNRQVLQEKLSTADYTLMGIESSSIRKAKTIFAQCMDTTNIEKLGAEPLKQAIKMSGGWSLSSGGEELFNAARFNFQEQLLKLHRYSYGVLFSSSVDTDSMNSSIYTINIEQSGLTLASEDDYNSTYDSDGTSRKKDAFIAWAAEAVRLLGGNITTARAGIEAIYEFESKLAKLYVPKWKIRNTALTYKSYTVEQFQKFFTVVNVSRHLGEVLNVTINSTTEVVTRETEYFQGLASLLEEYLSDEAKKQVLNNYLVLYTVNKNSGYLDSAFNYAKLILTNVTEGVNGIGLRWETCSEWVDEMMPKATGALYIDNRFSDQEKIMVTDIIKNVTSMFIDNLSHGWMDEVTATFAVDKARSIDPMVGYHPDLRNVSALDDYYKDFVVADGFFNTYLNYRLWSVSINAKKLNTVPDRTEWDMSVPTVSAYYNPSFNVIVLPAGILQAPFFDQRYPAAWNYGSLGSVVGHEISHGFDDQGSQFDKFGNLKNWWSNISKEAFTRSAKCMVDQYSSYKVLGHSVNGKLCLGENIADNGGVAVAYAAYKKLAAGREHTLPMLPGLNFTDDQLFFLAFSQLWCAKATDAYSVSSLSTNPHSPEQFRVRGTFSNSESFARAFQCKKGDEYKRDEPCKVW